MCLSDSCSIFWGMTIWIYMEDGSTICFISKIETQIWNLQNGLHRSFPASLLPYHGGSTPSHCQAPAGSTLCQMAHRNFNMLDTNNLHSSPFITTHHHFIHHIFSMVIPGSLGDQREQPQRPQGLRKTNAMTCRTKSNKPGIEMG